MNVGRMGRLTDCPKLMCCLIMASLAVKVHGLSLALDSIAEWGRFPRFCVDTYRWGDKFFNGYDTLYVDGTGYKFNVKLKTESWFDGYHPKFDNGTSMKMTSSPSTSAGLYLTYLAISAGYDINVSKYFGGGERARKRWDFQFNCMLFGADLYFINNDVGTNVTHFTLDDGKGYDTDIDFTGINTTEWGIDIYYFFKHKRYSQAAAFNFSRVQQRSSGSFFAGFSFSRHNYEFDFSSLPQEMLDALPDNMTDYRYSVNNYNYFLRGGYGYNWVFARDWLLGVSEAPMIGISRGRIDGGAEKTSFALLNKFKLSCIYNRLKWFGGLIVTVQSGIAGDSHRSIANSVVTMEISGGFRFNLW